MIEGIAKFDKLLRNLNNVTQNDSEMNMNIVIDLKNLLGEKTTPPSEQTYEWQCFLLIMFHEVIKKVLLNCRDVMTYEEFRENVINSLNKAQQYVVLNQTVLQYYLPSLENHNDDGKGRADNQGKEERNMEQVSIKEKEDRTNTPLNNNTLFYPNELLINNSNRKTEESPLNNGIILIKDNYKETDKKKSDEDNKEDINNQRIRNKDEVIKKELNPKDANITETNELKSKRLYINDFFYEENISKDNSSDSFGFDSIDLDMNDITEDNKTQNNTELTETSSKDKTITPQLTNQTIPKDQPAIIIKTLSQPITQTSISTNKSLPITQTTTQTNKQQQSVQPPIDKLLKGLMPSPNDLIFSQTQQLSKPNQNFFYQKSNYIIDSTVNDTTKRIDDLINNINMCPSIISFIQTIVNITDTTATNSLHHHLSLIPKRQYDNVSMNKIITLFLYFFPFLTENQKSSNLDRIKSMLPKPELLTPLNTNLLFTSAEKETRQFNTDIINNIFKDKTVTIEKLSKRIHSIQSLEDVKDLYFFRLMCRIIHIEEDQLDSDELLLCLANIDFLLIYFIENEDSFPVLKIRQTLYDCYTMKLFYNSLMKPFEEVVTFDYEKGSDIFFYNKRLLNSTNSTRSDASLNEIIDFLIDPSDLACYNNTMNSLRKFYKLSNYAIPKMISNNNLSFTLKNNELQYIKSKLIYNNLTLFREKLFILERELFQNAQSNKHETEISEHCIDHNLKKAFEDVKSKARRNVILNSWNYNLYPFGSVTQFLSAKDSDLDIYLDLTEIGSMYRVNFVRKFYKFILTEFDKYAVNRNSYRICLISFTYNRRYKIDISCLALCPYLHSNLIRCYSLMDARFSILTINLKKFLNILNLKNDNTKMQTLNSFCWIMLLIVFLQDIITPSVLPKLLVNSPHSGIKIEIGGSKPKHLQTNNNPTNTNKKTINQTFDSTSYHYIEVSPTAFANYEDIYWKMIEKNQKNEMSLSELFLKFLEFVIFLFKYDTVFVNCTFFNECFMNISDIKYQCEDFGMRRYYFTRYLHKPKGEILFREPYDYNYNPGQSLLDADVFMKKLKEAYFTLLKYGSFESLEKIQEKYNEDNEDMMEKEYYNYHHNNIE